MANTSATGGQLLPSGPDLPIDLEFDRVLSQLVRGITGLPDGMVRPRWQPNPPDEPDKDADWCAVGVTEQVPYDTPSQRHVSDGDGYTILRSTARVEVMASFYGPRARGLARLFVDALWVAQNREFLAGNGINFVDTGTLRSMPSLVNATNRWRTDVPLTLTHTLERRYEIRNLLQADGTIRADASGRLENTPFLSPLPPA